MKRINLHLYIISLLCILSICLVNSQAAADTLNVVENQVSSSSLNETTPTLGNDGVSDLVVYTSYVFNGVGLNTADIYYQRLLNGQADGPPVQVTSDLTDDQLNDVSGDYIVYTSYDNVDSSSGSIMLYQISTQSVQPLTIGSVSNIYEPKIHGNYVVWREGGVSSARVMIYDLSAATPTAQPLTGPTTATFNVEIGDRFVVWSERDGDFDIAGFDLTTGQRLVITGTGGTNERQPSTSGSWVVWQAQDFGSTSTRIEAYDLDAAPTDLNAFRSIVDDGAHNNQPSIDGDLITYESNATGNFDIYVYRLSTAETFAVTVDPGNQYLNDVYGGLVSYVQMNQNASPAFDEDIYVASLTFSVPDPCAALGGDTDGDGICNANETGPDLIVSSLTHSPAAPTTADLITFTAVVQNSGTDPAGASVLAFKVGGELNATGYWVPPLAPGASFTLQRQLTLGVAQSYQNSATADATATVIESDETNNVTLDSYQVIQAPPTAPALTITGGTVISTTQNPDGSWTYVIQGDGPLGGSYEVTIPAGTTALPGTDIEVKIDDQTGGAGKPEIELKNAVLPTGSTKTMTLPRPGGAVDELMCIEDISPEGEVAIGKTCNAKPGKGAVNLPGLSGSFDTDLGGDGIIRHVTYDATSVTVSGLLHSKIYLGVNHAPVADAGADQDIYLNQTANLNGAGSSDADGNTLSYAWTIVSAPVGSTATLSAPTASVTSLSADLAGQYIVSLVVNDGLVSSAADTVIVNASANLPPVAAATGTPVTGNAPLTVNFDAGASTDPEGLALTYDWDFDDGTADSGTIASHTYAAVGSYTAVVTVADGFGNTDQASVTITVMAPNMPPAAVPTATPTSGAAPLHVQFTANASDPDGDVLTYVWNFGDGGTSTDANPLHSYVNPGTYTATLTVTDGVNQPVSASAVISVDSALAIEVTEAKVDFGEHGKVKGKVTMKADFTYSGMPAATDVIKVVFDGLTLLETPFGAFEADDDDPGEYKYKQKKQHAKIDFTKGEIKVSCHKMRLDGIDNANGIDVVISFGDTVGADHFVMEEDEDENDDDHDHKKEMHHKENHKRL